MYPINKALFRRQALIFVRRGVGVFVIRRKG